MTKKKTETKETDNTANLGIGVVSTRFLNSKFGNMECKYHCYQDHTHIENDLKEILDEFQMIIEAGELVESQNPRTKEFILIDKSKGIIIGSYDKSFLNGC